MSQNIEELNEAFNSLVMLPAGMTVEPYGLPAMRVEFHIYALTLMRRRDYVIQFEAEHGMKAARLTPHLDCPAENDNAKFFDWIALHFWNKNPQLLRMTAFES